MPRGKKVIEYDVVVVGGGPVGLLMAYQLKRFGVSVCVFEQHEKETQDAYGRAIALFPRTTEQLDQLDLIEPMLQQGFACRSSVTYKDGERVLPGRVWTFMENIKDTTYDFTLVLRQMYTEAILREKLRFFGDIYHAGVECTDFDFDESAAADDYPITTSFMDKRSNETFQLRSKYVVGADGGRSFVRRRTGIPFEGDITEDQWVRIDGIVETNMPLNRSYGAIESKTHGNVLWAPLDRGATRIGYAFTPEIAAKYPDGITQEIAEKEAVASMSPFKVEFKEVHWWTLYTIGQRVAKEFSWKDRVFLCGDAAHTHSSGAAQGLNTGIHDAVNLGWKLALQIRGFSNEDVLKTYSVERMTAVEKLLGYDRDIATLMSHKWPSWYKGDPTADPYLILGEIFEQASAFNTGLGITYPANIINQVSSSGLSIPSGSRPPDVDLITPGTNQKIRFQRVTANIARFWVVIFTGSTMSTLPLLRELDRYHTTSSIKVHPAIDWVTITPVVGCSTYESIGMEPFGNAYYDSTGQAHSKFGVGMDKGGVAILRPDGLMGACGPIDGSWIQDYFSAVLKLDQPFWALNGLRDMVVDV